MDLLRKKNVLKSSENTCYAVLPTICNAMTTLQSLESGHAVGVPGGGHHVLGVGGVGVEVGGSDHPAHAREVVARVPGTSHAVAEP